MISGHGQRALATNQWTDSGHTARSDVIMVIGTGWMNTFPIEVESQENTNSTFFSSFSSVTAGSGLDSAHSLPRKPQDQIVKLMRTSYVSCTWIDQASGFPTRNLHGTASASTLHACIQAGWKSRRTLWYLPSRDSIIRRQWNSTSTCRCLLSRGRFDCGEQGKLVSLLAAQ